MAIGGSGRSSGWCIWIAEPHIDLVHFTSPANYRYEQIWTIDHELLKERAYASKAAAVFLPNQGASKSKKKRFE